MSFLKLNLVDRFKRLLRVNGCSKTVVGRLEGAWAQALGFRGTVVIFKFPPQSYVLEKDSPRPSQRPLV